MRVLINAYLKQQSDSLLFEKLFNYLEKIYEGANPLDFKNDVALMNFNMSLDDNILFLCVAQLFMAEQDLNYSNGKIQPPRAYLMGYLRFIKTKEENIDKILWSSIRHPPRVIYWRNWDKN